MFILYTYNSIVTFKDKIFCRSTRDRNAYQIHYVELFSHEYLLDMTFIAHTMFGQAPALRLGVLPFYEKSSNFASLSLKDTLKRAKTTLKCPLETKNGRLSASFSGSAS